MESMQLSTLCGACTDQSGALPMLEEERSSTPSDRLGLLRETPPKGETPPKEGETLRHRVLLRWSCLMGGGR